MKLADVESLDWDKVGGLLPAVVQDAQDGRVLMLGYVNREALRATLGTGRMTFWSRTRERLWTKGEISGHHLEVVEVTADCDRDTLLVLVRPHGPVCHTGDPDCFHGQPPTAATRLAFLDALAGVVRARIAGGAEGSYTARLHAQGRRRIAQKVGEEGLEVALAAVGEDDAAVVGEAADLLFHLIVLLEERGLALAEVVRELESRHAARG